MGIPVSGLILIPLTLGVYCFTSCLVEWAIFSSVLQGAALINIGGGFAVGLSTYFFVVVLMASRVVPEWATGSIRFFSGEPVVSHVRILVVFIIWCVFSAFALPVIFDGIPVDSPRMGVDQSYYIQSPLHWSASNAGQAGYMILNLVMVMCLLRTATWPGRLERLVSAFSWSGVFVAAVGAYQISCRMLGLAFPSWLFNSNQAWGQAPNQFIAGGFSRMSATFVEPSGAASFLAAWSVFELTLAISGGRRNGRHWVWAAVGSVMLVETTSTTGYVTAGIMWMMVACDCGATILRRGWIKVKASLAVIGFGSAAVIALITMPTAWLLLDAVLINKGASQSALHRTSTLGRAVEVFQQSWGLGVGLGSNRAMSVFFYVLSNLGFPGMLLMLWLLAQLYSLVRQRLYRPAIDPMTRGFLTALGSAFIADIISLLSSGAEITQPRVWILWGLLLATVRYDWLLERHFIERPLNAPFKPGRATEPALKCEPGGVSMSVLHSAFRGSRLIQVRRRQRLQSR
jgi:hypothetical protein